MPVFEFRFSTERKHALGELLTRAKPRLPADRIRFFLFECEREIKHCLKGYPAGWQTDERTPKRFEAVAKSAMALNIALSELDDTEKLALFAGVLVDRYESAVDIREAMAEARETNNLLDRLLKEAHHLNHGPGTPVKERLGEDIAYAIAISYVVSFKSLPSIRHDSAYKLFVDDITANDLPADFRVSIGKHKMESANSRAAVHLDYMQLNGNV